MLKKGDLVRFIGEPSDEDKRERAWMEYGSQNYAVDKAIYNFFDKDKTYRIIQSRYSGRVVRIYVSELKIASTYNGYHPSTLSFLASRFEKVPKPRKPRVCKPKTPSNRALKSDIKSFKELLKELDNERI